MLVSSQHLCKHQCQPSVVNSLMSLRSMVVCFKVLVSVQSQQFQYGQYESQHGCLVIIHVSNSVNTQNNILSSSYNSLCTWSTTCGGFGHKRSNVFKLTGFTGRLMVEETEMRIVKDGFTGLYVSNGQKYFWKIFFTPLPFQVKALALSTAMVIKVKITNSVS